MQLAYPRSLRKRTTHTASVARRANNQRASDQVGPACPAKMTRCIHSQPFQYIKIRDTFKKLPLPATALLGVFSHSGSCWPGEESVRLVPGKRNQVVGKTYSKERPRVRRRAPDEREHPREPREELPGTLQRKPLASFGAARGGGGKGLGAFCWAEGPALLPPTTFFRQRVPSSNEHSWPGEDMEDVVLQGRRQSYSSRRRLLHFVVPKRCKPKPCLVFEDQPWV